MFDAVARNDRISPRPPGIGRPVDCQSAAHLDHDDDEGSGVAFAAEWLSIGAIDHHEDDNFRFPSPALAFHAFGSVVGIVSAQQWGHHPLAMLRGRPQRREIALPS